MKTLHSRPSCVEALPWLPLQYSLRPGMTTGKAALPAEISFRAWGFLMSARVQGGFMWSLKHPIGVWSFEASLASGWLPLPPHQRQQGPASSQAPAAQPAIAALSPSPAMPQPVAQPAGSILSGGPTGGSVSSQPAADRRAARRRAADRDAIDRYSAGADCSSAHGSPGESADEAHNRAGKSADEGASRCTPQQQRQRSGDASQKGSTQGADPAGAAS